MMLEHAFYGIFFLRLISHKEGIYVNVNNVAGGGNSQVHDCTKHSHNAHTASCKARPHPLGPQALPCHPAPPAPVSCSVWLWCRLQCCPWQASASACLSLSPWLGLKGIVSNILLTSAHKHLHMGESNQSVGGTDIRFRLPSPSPTTQAAVCTGPLPLRFWQDNISPIPTLSICRKRDSSLHVCRGSTGPIGDRWWQCDYSCLQSGRGRNMERRIVDEVLFGLQADRGFARSW